MVVIAIQVNSERLQAALAEIQRGLGAPRPLMARLGKSLERELRSHFLTRDREGNRHGWPSRHFWNRQVRQNTALADVTDATATVRISSPPFAQKLYGGTIRAKRSKMLAIPLTPEAYAAGSPREGGIAGLFHVKGTPFLAVSKGRGKGKSLEIQYLLKASVTQAPDPRALPDMNAVGARLAAEAEAWVAKLRARA